MTGVYYLGTISDKDIEFAYLTDLKLKTSQIHRHKGITPLELGDVFFKWAGIYNPEKVFKTREW